MALSHALQQETLSSGTGVRQRVPSALLPAGHDKRLSLIESTATAVGQTHSPAGDVWYGSLSSCREIKNAPLSPSSVLSWRFKALFPKGESGISRMSAG